MLNKYRQLALAALLGVGAFAVPVSGASAAAIPAVNQIAAGDVTNGGNPLLVDVAQRCDGQRCRDGRRDGRWNGRRDGRWNGRWDGRWDGRRDGRWNGRWYGDRHRYRRNNFILFYGGYGGYGGGYGYGGYGGYGGGSNRHVQWCLDRYRSYNPRTNTWLSYSGHVRQCISPYSY